ncbi:MAG: hypothetical protein ACOC3X_01035 [Nanoarchaeota archaeon]
MEKLFKPLNTMVVSLLGFIISAVYTASGSFEIFFKNLGLGENFGLSLGFSFCLVFLMIFIASFVLIEPNETKK